MAGAGDEVALTRGLFAAGAGGAQAAPGNRGCLDMLRPANETNRTDLKL